MSSIDGVGTNTVSTQHSSHDTPADDGDGSGFGDVMSRVADGALRGVSAVAPAIPGGELVGMAADGLRGLNGAAPDSMPGAGDDQIQQMFDQQQQSQAFNLQYLELQNQIQQDNREFSTLSNLMKARHDTAKSAINNMHV